MRDPKLFQPWFYPSSNWVRWAVVVKSIFGLPLDATERKFFRDVFGDRKPPTSQVSEALILAGRGAGKSIIAALIVSYFAALMDWHFLKRKVRVLCLAADREQSEEVMLFVSQFFTESPTLAALVASRTKGSITLKSGVKLSIRTASARGIRGPAIAAAVCDELPAWIHDPSANSDTKILRALRPALGKVSGSLLVSIGSTGSRDGAAWEMFENHFGHDDAPILVAKATSRQLNITPEHRRAVEAAYKLDGYAAKSEYDSGWADDEAAFLSRERVTVTPEKNPTPPQQGRLFVGVDPNGGSAKGDAFSMAAAWVVNGRIKVGLIEAQSGRRDPTEVVAEFAAILRPYRHRAMLCSDFYAAGWVPSAFKKHGLTLHGPHALPKGAGGGKMSASDYYLALLGRLPLVDFPSHPTLTSEMFQLVRTPNGVDHPSGKHDDIANAVARAVYMAGQWLDQQAPVDEEPEPDAAELGEEYGTVMGSPDPAWSQRAVGTVISSDTWRPTPPRTSKGKPHPDSMAERLYHAGLNESYPELYARGNG